MSIRHFWTLYSVNKTLFETVVDRLSRQVGVLLLATDRGGQTALTTAVRSCTVGARHEKVRAVARTVYKCLIDTT